MSKFYRETKKGAQKSIADDGNWMTGVPAIVADNQDPERQHRVRLIIPSIDEDLIFDEWTRQMVFCLGNGFGSAFIPPIASEVVLFGQLGQKFNLFYASLYNEEMLMPEGYDDELTVGVHAPGNLKLIAELLAQIQAQNIEITAQQSALLKGNQINVSGSTITVQSDGSLSIAGGNISISGDTVKIHNRVVNKFGPAI